MTMARQLRCEQGFTFVELMGSLTLTLILVLSLYGAVDVNQKLTRNQQDIASMQQNGRSAIEFLARDLHSAGYNLVDNGKLETFGVIFPNVDCSTNHTTDSITMWHNPGEAEGVIIKDMPQPSSELVVDTADGFVVGDQAVIIGLGSDSLMHFDAFVVTEVQVNEGQGQIHLQHRPPINPDDFCTSYQAGSDILIVDTVAYFIAENADGVKEIYRQYRGRPATAVATHVTGLSFRYFSDGDPPVELTNLNSAKKRLAVRKIEITVGVETERAALDTGQKRTMTFTYNISPRNLIFKRNL